MNIKDIEEIKAALINERDRIIETPRVAPDREKGDEGDMAAYAAAQSLLERVIARDTLYLGKINKALAKFNDSTFGICEICEDEIGIKRLKARPTSVLCINCKEDQEKSEETNVYGRRSKSLDKLGFYE